MYQVLTQTSWQAQPVQLNLTEIREAISPYPLIERQFFDDIMSLCHSQQHYVAEMGLLQVLSPEKKELNADFWILVWGVDFRDRIFQILIERHPDHQGKGAIAAAGPLDFFEFLSSMKQNAILPTLTLLASTNKMKTLAVIVSKPKNYQEKAKEKQSVQALDRFQGWINTLKATPNVRGQWFPSAKPLCPICNEPLLEFNGVEVGFGMKQLVCPRCGATKPIL
jgi:hypothetical protein